MSLETDESDEEVRIMPRCEVAKVPSQAAKEGLDTRKPEQTVPVHEVSDDTMFETVSKVQEPPVGENSRVLNSIGGAGRTSAFQTLMQGSRGAEKSKADLGEHPGGGISQNQTVSGTNSAMLSVVESMQQVATALQLSLARSATLSAKTATGNKKVKALKMNGQARPTVKGAMSWLKELKNMPALSGTSSIT